MARRFPAIRGLFPLILLACVAGAFLRPLAANALPPKYFVIEDPHVFMRSGDIQVSLSIGVDDVGGLFAMLKDGASVELVAKARLERLRTLWANVTLAETERVSVLQHNPLTREFALLMPGETSPLLDKNLHRLLEATWNKFVFTVGPVSALDGEEGDTEYRVAVTLTLEHAKPPPWLAKSFMFWSRKIVEPEEILLPFKY